MMWRVLPALADDRSAPKLACFWLRRLLVNFGNDLVLLGSSTHSLILRPILPFPVACLRFFPPDLALLSLRARRDHTFPATTTTACA